jgi:hypothetical protein
VGRRWADTNERYTKKKARQAAGSSSYIMSASYPFGG